MISLIDIKFFGELFIIVSLTILILVLALIIGVKSRESDLKTTKDIKVSGGKKSKSSFSYFILFTASSSDLNLTEKLQTQMIRIEDLIDYEIVNPKENVFVIELKTEQKLARFSNHRANLLKDVSNILIANGIEFFNIEFYELKSNVECILERLNNRHLNRKVIVEGLQQLQKHDLDVFEHIFNEEIRFRLIETHKDMDIVTFWISVASKLEFDDWETSTETFIPIEKTEFYFAVKKFQQYWKIDLGLEKVIMSEIKYIYEIGKNDTGARMSYVISSKGKYIYFGTSHLYY